MVHADVIIVDAGAKIHDPKKTIIFLFNICIFFTSYTFKLTDNFCIWICFVSFS